MNRHEVDAHDADAVEPVTLGRLARTLKEYRVPIFLSIAAVACGYLIIAAIILLTSPTLTVTSLPFRLEFEGAESGHYPNGAAFSPTEIVAQPILARVWEANNLKRFMPLSAFTKSLYVIEANAAMEQLVRDYQARLSDPKLSPVDRDRLVREFETKKGSISKNEYSLNFSAAREQHRLPDALAKKVLSDVLKEWAEYATREQRVLQYSIAVLSPNIVPPQGGPDLDYVARLQVLRSNIYRVIANINEIEALPGGRLARTRADQLTLNDVRTKLEDIVRFRLEPLVPAIRASGLIPNINEAIRFAEMQLAYDERRLADARERAAVTRQAILTYANARGSSVPPELAGEDAPREGDNTARQGGDTVTPQLSDSFLDRIMALTASTADVSYRQSMIDDYREQASQMVPLQQAVTYDKEVIEQLRSAAPGSASVTAEEVERRINAMQREVHVALKQINELYVTVSRNLMPETHMFSATSVPTTRTQRRISAMKLGVIGILVMILAIPIILIAVLIHARVRQEDVIEERRHAAPAAV